jgi:hypothetical protein
MKVNMGIKPFQKMTMGTNLSRPVAKGSIYLHVIVHTILPTLYHFSYSFHAHTLTLYAAL